MITKYHNQESVYYVWRKKKWLHKYVDFNLSQNQSSFYLTMTVWVDHRLQLGLLLIRPGESAEEVFYRS